MSQPLFPVVQVPEFVPQNTKYDMEYRRSAKWDPVKGDFVRDGTNRVVECDGKEAYSIWCFKIAQTERYRCLAYPNSIGVEMERALDNDDVETVESMVQRTITEALMVNPRTEDVWDFEFSWKGDNVYCRFKVKGVDCDEITIAI
ncbi:MAG: DUF2634 domain-containing protein [Lachnospiraceae bacterium]